MKTKFAFIVGSIATIGGMVFAAMAQSIAFNNVTGYPTTRSETSYAAQEQVLQNIGLLFLAFGLLLILTTFRECLRASHRDHRPARNEG
jgi:hypothetical protein